MSLGFTAPCRRMLCLLCFTLVATWGTTILRAQDEPLPDNVAQLIELKAKVLDEINANPDASDDQKIAMGQHLLSVERKAIEILESKDAAALKGLTESAEMTLEQIEKATASNAEYLADLQLKRRLFADSVKTLEYAVAKSAKVYGEKTWQTGDYQRKLDNSIFWASATPEQLEKWDAIVAMNRQAGELLESKGELAAVEMIKKVKASLEALELTRSTHYLDNAYDLAVALTNANRNQEAEKAYESGLELFQKILGESHPSNATLLISYAQLARNEGKPDVALQRLAQAENVFKSAYGDQSAPLARVHLIKGRVYHDLEKYEEATDQYLASFKMYVAIGQETSQPILDVLRNQYDLYKETASLEGAATIAEIAVKTSFDVYGVDSVESADWLYKQGWAERAIGNNERALDKLTLARSTFENIAGHQANENYVLTVANLAMTLHALDRSSEAEMLAKKATDLAGALAGENSYFYAMRAQNYGVILSHEKKFDEAEKWMARAMPLLEKEIGDSPEFLLILHDRAANSFSNNKFDDAIKFWQQLGQEQKKIMAETDSRYMETLESLKEAYAKKGDRETSDSLGTRIDELKTLVASSSVIASAMSDSNRMKQIGLAVLSAHDEHGRFLFPMADETTQVSWRVMLLPYLDQLELFKRFSANEVWDSANNKPLVENMPVVFGKQSGVSDVRWVRSFDRQFKFSDIKDGSSNTIMLVQHASGAPWTQRDDLSIEEAVKLVRGLETGQSILATYYDGHVSDLTSELDVATLTALFTPTGGEVIDLSVVEKTMPSTEPVASKTIGRELNDQERAEIQSRIEQMISIIQSGDTDRTFEELVLPAEFAEMKKSTSYEETKLRFMDSKAASLVEMLQSIDVSKAALVDGNIVIEMEGKPLTFTHVDGKWYIKN